MRTGSSVTGRADSGRLHFNRCPTRSWAGWWRLDAASFCRRSWRRGHQCPRCPRPPLTCTLSRGSAARDTSPGSCPGPRTRWPAQGRGQAEAGVTRRPWLWCPGARGTAGLEGGRCTAGKGIRQGPGRPPSRQGHPGAGLGQGSLPSRAPTGPAQGLGVGRVPAEVGLAQGGGIGRPGPGAQEGKGLGTPRPPRLPAPGRVLEPLSPRSSNLRVGSSRPEGAATVETGRSRRAAVCWC